MNNVDPTITLLTVPLDPVDINDQLSFSVDVTFTDPAGILDQPYTCNLDMDDDGVDDITVTDVMGTSCSTPLNYSEPGVYIVTATVTDKDGGVSDPVTATEFIVIFGPDGGFVTGGGWINSPEGACTFEDCTDDTTGKANFGFVSKYKKGASVPTGNAEFQFQAGELNFHSTSYDWLVIAGPKAMYKGDGRVNGVDGFSFQINAIDGQVNGGGGVDKFRIKIKEAGGGVIYDNQMGAGDNEDPTTALGGGSIKTHTGGNGNGNNLVIDDAGWTSETGTGVLLNHAMLATALEQAITYWTGQGIDQAQLDQLQQADVWIEDLGGSILGNWSASDNTITIDRDAAGHGWNLITSDQQSVNAKGLDLLSAVAHELGHVLGYEHDFLGSALGVDHRQLPLLESVAGDANRDGVFDRFDLFDVLEAGKYLTGEPATWSDGDWTGDGLFDQRDIVAALQSRQRRAPQHQEPAQDETDAAFAELGRGP